MSVDIGKIVKLKNSIKDGLDVAVLAYINKHPEIANTAIENAFYELQLLKKEMSINASSKA